MGKVSDAAVALEEAFFRSIPSGKKKLSEGEWLAALTRFQEKAKEVRRSHSLGVVGRARAAYMLQQRLIAAGYPGDVVRKVMFALLLNAFTGRA